MSIQRNAPCPCGSGKKYKKCCMNKKTVLESVMFEFETPTSPASFSIGANREIKAFDAAGTLIKFKNSNYVRSYERSNKGEKTLTKIPMFKPTLPQHELEYLLNFHSLYAIDTNTDKATKISAATAIKCKLTIRDKTLNGTTINGHVLMESEVVDQRYWKDLDVNPEKVAIHNLIKGINYLPGSKIGIISDCDLGNMADINSLQTPLIDDYYMPSAFTLIYASADAGKSSIANQLLFECDKNSKAIINEVKSNPSKYFPSE